MFLYLAISRDGHDVLMKAVFGNNSKSFVREFSNPGAFTKGVLNFQPSHYETNPALIAEAFSPNPLGDARFIPNNVTRTDSDKKIESDLLTFNFVGRDFLSSLCTAGSSVLNFLTRTSRHMM